MNSAKKNTNTVRESNLITLASPCDTTVAETVAKSFEGSVKRCRWNIAETSNLITLGSNTAEVQPVSTPPELCGYGYYVGSAGYSSTLPVSLTEPLTSNLHYYTASSVEQQTDTQRIQEKNLITPDKSLKSSERKFYMGGRKTRSRKVHRSNLLASVDPPDLASVERSNSGRKASISRHLLVVSKCPLTQEQIFSLFGVVPGLECCETPPHLYNNHVFAVIRYRNIASAVYAKCRLHGLEYPLGNQLHVSFLESETHGTNSSLIQEMATQVVTSQLASVIWNNNWAPQLLASSQSRIPSPSLQTDAELPSRKRKAPPDSPVREKLFIVFDPCPLPQDVLDNVLSRFGNFINSHLIPGENVAYAKFAERTSASHAIAMLHGKTVNGVKLKVILADLPTGL
ncbi:RNA-binding protein 45-like isoform X1 [Sceloporus undulatus]|uniref:RNA-binding protein 45-like isoform X1 n=1 Tax=Sceloporus undulatus TaxID=8520 RepID=UPI001C4D70BA|nr:RNA-binding protein 45-like isoform X1 [Sceloporus undulatus]